MSALVATTTELGALSAAANEAHARAERAVVEALGHAVTAGEALIAARALVPHGGWQEWVEGNFAGSYPTAYLYERIARNKDALMAANTTTVVEARAFLVSEGLGTGFRGHATDEVKNAARRMAGEGLSALAISQELGWSDKSIARWIDPERAKRHRERVKARRTRRAQERAALERKERDEAAKRVGGDVALAYSTVLRLAAQLDAASRGATSREARAALDAAYHRCREAEDAINEAVRRS